MSGGELRVDPAAVSKYAGEMLRFGLDSAMKVPQVLAEMPSTAQNAFANYTGAGVFAEAALMLAAAERLNTAFTAFNADVAEGIQAIANAAEVCAVSYQNTDLDSANSLGLVDFAFADPTAGRPAGIADNVGKTMVDAMMENQAALPDALRDPDGGTTVSFPYGTVTTYPDGSTRSAVSHYATVSGTSISAPTYTVTYTDANGTVVGRTSETSYTQNGVATVVRTDGNASTTTATNRDGSKRIVTTVRNPDTGEERTTSTVNLPPPAEDTRPDTEPDQPLADAVDTLGPGAGGVTNPGAAGYPMGSPVPVPAGTP